METQEFTYTTYIAAPPEKVWNALIDPEITVKYWQHVNVSDWKPGSRWEHRQSGKENSLDLVGKVLTFTPPRKLVISWASPSDESIEEKYSKVTIDVESFNDVTRLIVLHENLEPDSDMLEGITDGWPKCWRV